MPVASYKLGPGTLKLGPVATPELDASCQLTACTLQVTENVEETSEELDVLCGETLAAEESATYDYVLSGTMVQDLAAAGVVAWSWDNKGTPKAFEFVPSTAQGTKVSGTLIPVPLNIGGAVKSRPTADFTWRLTVEPTRVHV